MTRGPSRDVPAKEHEPAEARADHGRMTTPSSAARRRERCRDRTRTPKPVAEEAEAGLAVALSDDATIEVATDLHERSTHSTGAVSEGPRDPGPIFDRGAMEAPRRPTARIVAHPDGDGGLNRVGDPTALITLLRGGWGGRGCSGGSSWADLPTDPSPHVEGVIGGVHAMRRSFDEPAARPAGARADDWRGSPVSPRGTGGGRGADPRCVPSPPAAGVGGGPRRRRTGPVPRRDVDPPSAALDLRRSSGVDRTGPG